MSEELENWQRCKYRMVDEGFHYCFHGYSNWQEIKDEEFHKLRKAYLEASEKLKNYIEEKANETD